MRSDSVSEGYEGGRELVEMEESWNDGLENLSMADRLRGRE